MFAELALLGGVSSGGVVLEGFVEVRGEEEPCAALVR